MSVMQPMRDEDWSEQPLAVKWSHHKNQELSTSSSDQFTQLNIM